MGGSAHGHCHPVAGHRGRTVDLHAAAARDHAGHHVDPEEDRYPARGRGHLRHHQRGDPADREDRGLRVLRAHPGPDRAGGQRGAVPADQLDRRQAGAAVPRRPVLADRGTRRVDRRHRQLDPQRGHPGPGQGRAQRPVSQHRRGYLFGIGAYVSWGFFPLYFKLLRPAGPLEILAHRVVWSALFVAVLLTLARNWRRIIALRHRPRTLLVIGIAAVLIAVNWGTYIYGVNTARVVETSLGYFITPLISVAFGLAVFGERLRPAQWVAIGVGTAAVAVLAVDYGRLPWIALTLAGSFASYGLVKKRLGLPPTDGLFVESAVLALPGLGYLTWLAATGRSTFTDRPGHMALLL